MADVTPVGSEPNGSRRRGGEGASWIAGVVLILLGVAFFLEQSHYISFEGNWWAIFIYLAAIASFGNAWRSYRTRGEFGAQASGSLIWGLVLTVVASIFFFNLLWDVWWPAILVAVGVGIVLGNLLRNTRSKA
jgi:hypothetical protein